MAWLDDRAWCHPKLVDLSDKAFRVYVNGLAYSSGMVTRGTLTPGQQKLLGCEPRIRKELIAAGVWDDTDGKAVEIHDWSEHNGKRDDRREKDRERKRLERQNDPDGWITRSGKWTRTRKAVLERDDGICVDCGEQTDTWHADHVPSRAVLRERGLDPFDIQYIQTRCNRCHSRKHSLERHKLRTELRTDDGQQRRPARVEGSEGSEGINLRPLGGFDERSRPVGADQEDPDGPVGGPGENHGSVLVLKRDEPAEHTASEVQRMRADIQERFGA